MIIEDEREYVNPGDAVHIPSNSLHGIKNVGDETLEYITANAPAFDEEYEKKLWPGDYSPDR